MASADLVKESQRVQLQLIMRYIDSVSPGKRLQIFDSPATEALDKLNFVNRSQLSHLLTCDPELGKAPLVWLENDDTEGALETELQQSIKKLDASLRRPARPLMQGTSNHFLIVGHSPQSHVMALKEIEDLFQRGFQSNASDVRHVLFTSGLQARPVTGAVANDSHADDPLLQYMLVVFRIVPDRVRAPADIAQADPPSTDQHMQEALPEKQGFKRVVEPAAGAGQEMQAAKKQRRVEVSSAGDSAHAEGDMSSHPSQPISQGVAVVNPVTSGHASRVASASLLDQPGASKQAVHSDAAHITHGPTSREAAVQEEPSVADGDVRLANNIEALLCKLCMS